MYSIYLRHHDGALDLETRTRTAWPATALAAYRALLGRRDLDGQPIAAVLRDQVRERTLLFSRFDFERQQLLPDDAIDLAALASEVADISTCAIVAARPAGVASDDAPALVARAKADPAMIRDYATRPDSPELSDAELAAALGYAAPRGRDTVKRMAAGSGTRTAQLLLMALLDGWRPKGSAA